MEELPRKSSFATPARCAASITFSAIARLSRMKSAGKLELARMPPALAAATITYSGRVSAKSRSTAARSARSVSCRVRTTTFR
jgi:hypothetical protein